MSFTASRAHELVSSSVCFPCITDSTYANRQITSITVQRARLFYWSLCGGPGNAVGLQRARVCVCVIVCFRAMTFEQNDLGRRYSA